MAALFRPSPRHGGATPPPAHTTAEILHSRLSLPDSPALKALLDFLRGALHQYGVRPASESIDWPLFCDLARAHRVSPLVVGVLSMEEFDAVPDSVRTRLGSDARAFSLKNLAATRALLRAHAGLEKAGLDYLLLKGPAVAYRLYDDLGHRPFKDLDLWVHPSELADACRALENVGFSWPTRLDRRGVDLGLRSGSDTHTTLTWSGVECELHSRPSWRYDLPFRKAWREQAEVRILETAVPTLGDRHLGLYLPLHGSYHGWARLRWLVDLHRLRSRLDIEWNSVHALAKRMGQSAAFEAGWLLAQEFLGTETPLQSEATSRRAYSIALAGTDNWEHPDKTLSRSQVEMLRADLSTLDRRRDRVLILLKLVVQPGPKDWDVVPAVSHRTPVFFSLVRLARLLLTGLVKGPRWLLQR
ncbi:MAG: hypothetical protein ACI9BV_003823 [Rhodothermales bacterium]|jgi:hypothetical protein